MLIARKPREWLRDARNISAYDGTLKCSENHATLHEAKPGQYFLGICTHKAILLPYAYAA